MLRKVEFEAMHLSFCSHILNDSMPTPSTLKQADPEIFAAMKNELGRQRDCLEMIPSENFTSLNVLHALGSVLTNKYSEGYPKKGITAGTSS